MTTAQHGELATRRHTEQVVYNLGRIIRERDVITYEHCRRVAIYLNRLARWMGWSRRGARDLALAGLVHDLGKTWMLNTVLHKESALSSDERAEMERHPMIAASILGAYGAPAQLIAVVRHHHEAWDGRGYPDHLEGEEIPLGARLLAVVDAFDALTSERSYKPAMDLATARRRITSSGGSHFDPRVVAAFETLLEASPDFLLPPRVSPLPVRMTAAPAWMRHDTAED